MKAAHLILIFVWVHHDESVLIHLKHMNYIMKDLWLVADCESRRGQCNLVATFFQLVLLLAGCYTPLLKRWPTQYYEHKRVEAEDRVSVDTDTGTHLQWVIIDDWERFLLNESILCFSGKTLHSIPLAYVDVCLFASWVWWRKVFCCNARKPLTPHAHWMRCLLAALWLHHSSVMLQKSAGGVPEQVLRSLLCKHFNRSLVAA